jgi:hypothetical protein
MAMLVKDNIKSKQLKIFQFVFVQISEYLMLVENLPACTWLVLASDCLAAED